MSAALDAAALNARVRPRVDALVADAAAFGVRVHDVPGGGRVLDLGVEAPGSVAAGLTVAEICMAGLGSARLAAQHSETFPPTRIEVHVRRPDLACLASQYAGWSAKHVHTVDGEETKFRAMLSGPGRALVRREPLFEEAPFDALAGPSAGDAAVFVLEGDALPPDSFIGFLADAAGVAPAAVDLLVTPTASRAGGAQIVARVVEVALHRAHDLDFDVTRIVEGFGTAPLAPPGGDFLTAMGRTNDAILYGGTVHLFVTGDADSARDLAERLPSTNSKDHGKPFAQTFADADHDFYAIDPGLFCPAKVWVTATEGGQTFEGGALSPDIVRASFELDPSR